MDIIGLIASAAALISTAVNIAEELRGAERTGRQLDSLRHVATQLADLQRDATAPAEIVYRATGLLTETRELLQRHEPKTTGTFRFWWPANLEAQVASKCAELSTLYHRLAHLRRER
jgi:hypothetical protein